MNKKAATKKSPSKKSVPNKPKDTYLVIRVPSNPKPGSVANIEVIAHSKPDAKRKMKSYGKAEEGAAYCLVKVEDQFEYHTTYTSKKTTISFGEK